MVLFKKQNAIIIIIPEIGHGGSSSCSVGLCFGNKVEQTRLFYFIYFIITDHKQKIPGTKNIHLSYSS